MRSGSRVQERRGTGRLGELRAALSSFEHTSPQDIVKRLLVQKPQAADRRKCFRTPSRSVQTISPSSFVARGGGSMITFPMPWWGRSS